MLIDNKPFFYRPVKIKQKTYEKRLYNRKFIRLLAPRIINLLV